MGKPAKKILTAVVIMVLVAVIVIVVFLAVTNMYGDDDKVDSSSEMGQLLEKDLDTKYPDTASEVVKLYWRYNKCMYNNAMSDGNFEKMLKQLRILYDNEFLSKEENSWENMLSSFKKERDDYMDNKRMITIYTVEPGSSTEYGKIDGKESASVICSAMVKEKSERKKVYERFICRRDDDGNWKILGWEQVGSDGAVSGGEAADN